jgi:hypothetical protein
MKYYLLTEEIVDVLMETALDYELGLRFELGFMDDDELIELLSNSVGALLQLREMETAYYE